MKKMTKNKEDLIGKLHRTISLMSCESRISRDYGTAHELTASDIDFIKNSYLKDNICTCIPYSIVIFEPSLWVKSSPSN